VYRAALAIAFPKFVLVAPASATSRAMSARVIALSHRKAVGSFRTE